jgi:threonine/homoserine/homoserine lactone efflux protein
MGPIVDPAKYLAFLGVMAVMAWTPGPANLFAIATGAERGKGAALVAVAGMNTGSLVWFVGAALGLSALIAAFPAVFHLLAYAGAAYVGWLGLKSLHAAATDKPAELEAAEGRHGSAFWSGFAVQITNPKALLFFAAVLPPFLDADRALGPQLAVFAAGTIGMDLVSMSVYGLGGAALAAKLSEPRFRRAFQTAVGLLLVSAAVLIALRG